MHFFRISSFIVCHFLPDVNPNGTILPEKRLTKNGKSPESLDSTDRSGFFSEKNRQKLQNLIKNEDFFLKNLPLTSCFASVTISMKRVVKKPFKKPFTNGRKKERQL